MFGRKKEMIKNLESLTDTLCSEVDFLKRKLSRRNEIIAELEQTLKQLRDIHYSFSKIQNYLMETAERIRINKSKLVYTEKHKTAENNIFAAKSLRNASDIENIARALYEIEKAEEVR